MDRLEELIKYYARIYAETRDKKNKELIDKISSQSIDILAGGPYAAVLKQKYENKKYNGGMI